MKNLIVKTALFITLALLSFAALLSLADGHTDPFYKRFTSPPQQNLIIGTSRAAQGIKPQVLDSILNRSFFNYAFTIAHSPFGEVYLNSIRKKLDSTTQNGIFIIAIDPWAFTSTTFDDNKQAIFREEKMALGITNEVNQNPNFEYLLKNLKGEYYKVLGFNKTSMFLHDDGWLEVTVPMDSESLVTRTTAKIENYATHMKAKSKFVEERYQAFVATIQFLKQHGKVYLVRLPVCKEIWTMEEEVLPNFDSLIAQAMPLCEGYMDYSSQHNLYKYTDGNHLWKVSSHDLSVNLAQWLLTFLPK